MSAIERHETALKAFRGAKPKFISYLNHRQSPEGIRKLYEKGYSEYQELKVQKAKLLGPYLRAKYFLHS